MVAHNLSIDDLARRCAEETEQYNHRQVSDERFCLELMRLALGMANPEAFTHVYRIYEPQVIRWVFSHSWFERTGEQVGYFAGAALSSFYFSLRGSKFERFPSVPLLMGYLKVCVHSAIAQYVRDQQPMPPVALADLEQLPSSTDVEKEMFADELWTHICRILTDETDRLLANLALVQQRKPASIVIDYPQHWENERAVSVALQRIRRALRKDPELRRLAGLDSASPSDDPG